MSKFACVATGAALLFAAAGAHAAGTLYSATHTLSGTVEFDSVVYKTSVKLDQVRYGNGTGHKAYLKPQSYKRTVEPALPAGVKIKCDGVDGNGTKGWGGKKPQVACELKKGNGGSAVKVPFHMTTLKGRTRGVAGTEVTASKQLQGTLDYLGAKYSLSLELDVVSYQSGNGHKAFIKAERAGHRIDTAALAGSGIRLTSCTDGMKTHQTDVIAGRKPVVTCDWKKGNGQQPEYNYGTVELK